MGTCRIQPQLDKSSVGTAPLSPSLRLVGYSHVRNLSNLEFSIDQTSCNHHKKQIRNGFRFYKFFSLPPTPKKTFIFLTQELLTEAYDLKPTYQEITTLSKSIISYLNGVHKSSADALQGKLDQLDQQYMT